MLIWIGARSAGGAQVSQCRPGLRLADALLRAGRNLRALCQGVRRARSQIAVGNGLDAANHMGPMANPRRPEAIEGFVANALKVGARIATGGERGGGIHGNGFFFRPTVLADVPLEARVMNEEPFGPIALMRPFKTFDEADRTGQSPTLWAGGVLLHGERTARAAVGRRHRERHDRHQHHHGRRRGFAVRRSEGLRARLGGRARKAWKRAW